MQRPTLMRSPIGPILLILGLATTLVLVLLLVQTLGLRGELETARAEMAELRTQVTTADDAGVTGEELDASLADLETRLETLLADTNAGGGGGDPSQPAGGSGSDDLADQLDEILQRIAALDDRVDEICGNVPVC